MTGRPLHRVLAATFGLALLAAAAGCGSGGSSSVAAATATTSTPSPSPSDPPSPSPDASSSFQAAVDPAHSVGSVLLTAGAEQQVCGQAFADGTGAAPTDAGAAVTTSSSVGLRGGSDSVTLLPGGRAMLSCTAGVTVVDLFDGRILWKRELRSDDSTVETVTTGTDHVVLLTTTHNPASDLQAAYDSFTVTALASADGSEAWTQPFEDFVDKSQRAGTNLTVEEGPLTGSGTSVLLLHGSAWSAFDPATGKPLWHVEDGPRPDGCRLGVCLGSGDGDASVETVATELRTGRVLWHKRLPDVGGRTDDVTLHGGTAYLVGNQGVLAFELATGRLRLDRLFPTSWSGSTPIVTPDLTLAFDGAQVALYRTSNLNTPLWTAKGDGGTPVAVSPGLVAVSAPGGTVVLDAKTGDVRHDVVLPEAAGTAWTVRDGLAVLGDGSVLELSPPTSRS